MFDGSSFSKLPEPYSPFSESVSMRERSWFSSSVGFQAIAPRGMKVAAN